MKSLKDYILESSSNKIAISFINQDNIEDFMYNAFEDKNSNAYSEVHKGEIEEYLLQWIDIAFKNTNNPNNLDEDALEEDFIAYIEQFLEDIPSKVMKNIKEAFKKFNEDIKNSK